MRRGETRVVFLVTDGCRRPWSGIVKGTWVSPAAHLLCDFTPPLPPVWTLGARVRCEGPYSVYSLQTSMALTENLWPFRGNAKQLESFSVVCLFLKGVLRKKKKGKNKVLAQLPPEKTLLVSTMNK